MIVGVALLGLVVGWAGIGFGGRQVGAGLQGAVGGMSGAVVASALCGGMVWIIARRVEPVAWISCALAGSMAGTQAVREGKLSAAFFILLAGMVFGTIMGTVAYVGQAIRARRGRRLVASVSDPHFTEGAKKNADDGI